MLTPADIAAELNTSARTVNRLIKSGQLPGIALDRVYRVRREDFDAFLAARSTRTPA